MSKRSKRPKRRKPATRGDVSPFNEITLKPFYPIENAQNTHHSSGETQSVARASLYVIEPIIKLSLDGTPPKDTSPDGVPLPEGLEWADMDMDKAAHLDVVYDLLANNYVGSDGHEWSMNYSRQHIRWALPGVPFFQVAVRKGDLFLGFITAIPRTMGIYDTTARMVELNFLCVHQSYRNSGLAPLLLKEATRRVKIRNRWQGGIYTTARSSPPPSTLMASAQCYHRMLSVKKMIDVGFFPMHKRLTMKGMRKLYSLPEDTAILGLRLMRRRDEGAVAKLLNAFLKQYHLRYIFTKAEVARQFLPRGFEGIAHSYVVENDEGKITDFISFYQIRMMVTKGGHFDAAYALYNVAGSVTWSELMMDALVLAKRGGCDVFNCTDVMENSAFLADLKFHPGSGQLQYYLYNWRAPPTRPGGVGVVMI